MSFAVSSIAYGAVDFSADVTTANFNLSAYELLLIYMAGYFPSNSPNPTTVSGETLFLLSYASATTTPNHIRIYTLHGMVYADGVYNIKFWKADGVLTNPYVYHVIKVSGVNSSGLMGSGATYTYSTNQTSSATSLSNTVTLSASPSLNVSAFAHLVNENITIGSGFTNLTSVTRSSPNVSLRIGYLQDVGTAAATWATSSEAVSLGISLKTEQTIPPKKFIVL